MKNVRLLPFAVLALALIGVSCSTMAPKWQQPPARKFNFQTDTFAFPNDVKALTPNKEDLYALHCFVMSTNAHRFFKFARFDASLPKVSDKQYHSLTRRVVRTTFFRQPLPEAQRVVIPGYPNLRAFSAENEKLIKDAMGSNLITLITIRNWRMSLGTIPPLQARTAKLIQQQLARGVCDQLHVVDSPIGRKVDHSILVFDAREEADRIEFLCYDPNLPDAPITLTYDKQNKSFSLPKLTYFVGGRVSVYRIYHSLLR